MIKRLLNYTFLLCFPMLMIAQNSAKLTIGEQFINSEVKEKHNLTGEDLNGMIITDQYTSKHNGVTHIYYQQTYNGVPIQNANMNLNITKENTIPFYRTSFYKDVKSLVNSERAVLSPEEAISQAAKSLDLPVAKSASMLEEISNISYKYENKAVSRKVIPVNLKYQEAEDGSLRLVWDVELAVPGTSDHWSLKMDAKTGDLISKYNYTLYCNIDHTASRTARSNKNCNGIHSKADILKKTNKSEAVSSNAASGSYRAYVLPTESPIHGDHSLVSQPHNTTASPFGWHDIDGIDGADFNITRGNNVHAFLDADGDGFSSGDEPDGGVDLIFDFPHDTEINADENADAAVVNLFYSINAIHDLLYEFGFDEAAGNCQFNNYGNGGLENDHFIAKEADPGIANNAAISIAPDGLSPEMIMGIWTTAAGVVFVNEPEELKGTIDAIGAADGWGHLWTIDAIDVSGDVVLATDGGLQGPTQCCNDIINSDEVMGNIALIDRGLCEFGTKGLKAQEAGAVAVIICNVSGVDGGNGEELVNMAPGADGVGVTIPAVFAAKSFCDRVKLNISNGVNVNLQFTNQDMNSGPDNFNSSFDNGVVAHEFGHIVNSRLVGGPGNPAGLSNAEQMGEGWSDLFSVAFTIEENDSADDPRGVGTYVARQIPDGRGIRAFPYSRDMEISPYTYDYIIGTNEVHAIGEIWAAMCWDIVWNFIDLYGFDSEWKNPDSGNYRALLLIMDGFKLVGSRPGFADARDAIIVADEINYQGEHKCMLWETFARRGLGFNADQGSPDDSNDGVEGFENAPECQSAFKITKTVSDFIQPGDDVDVTLFVGNYTSEMAENAVVVDNIPDGLTYIDGSGSMAPSVNGNELTFSLDNMDPLEEITITYKLSTDPADASTTLVYDDIEDIGNEWIVDFINADGFNLWSTSQLAANSPVTSWYVEAVEDDSQQTLIYNGLEVTGTNPALRFWNSINTNSTIEGGFIELSTDDGLTWFRVDDKFIRNGYPRALAYTTFAIPGLNAFSGNSGGFIDSYLDLSEYIGETINVKFRFGTQEPDMTPLPANAPGWFVDDFELMDLLKHESSACVDADNLDIQCTEAATTIVDSEGISSAFEADVEGFEFKLYPNPATDNVSINLKTETTGDYILKVTTIDGRQMYKQNVSVNQSNEFFNINLRGMNAGFYIVQLETQNGTITRKLIVE